MASFKLCKDCKHCSPAYEWWLLLFPVVGWLLFLILMLTNWRWRFSRCSRAPNYGGFYFCSTERAFDCGAHGKYFEANKP